jgi:hypothetical protein
MFIFIFLVCVCECVRGNFLRGFVWNTYVDSEMEEGVEEGWSPWLWGFAVVTFDLEYGPRVEATVPASLHSRLLAEAAGGISVEAAVAHLAFPESHRPSTATADAAADESFRFRFVAPMPPLPSTGRRRSLHTDSLHVDSSQSKVDNCDEDSDNNEEEEEEVEEDHCEDLSAVSVFGFSFFRQQRVVGRTRGFFQKALVLLSPRNDYALFKPVVAAVAHPFLDAAVRLATEIPPSAAAAADDSRDGSGGGGLARRRRAVSRGTDAALSIVAAAYRSMVAWPAPRPKARLELPVGGVVHVYHVPSSAVGAGVAGAADEVRLAHKFIVGLRAGHVAGRGVGPLQEEPPLCNFDCLDLRRLLRDHLSSLWLLWELVLLNEPLLVVGGTAADVSDVVTALASLIFPLSYVGECHPYFTVQSPDYERYDRLVNEGVFPHALIGVTNPFFLKQWAVWPHTLTCASDALASGSPSRSRSAPRFGLRSARGASVVHDKKLIQRVLATPPPHEVRPRSSDDRNAELEVVLAHLRSLPGESAEAQANALLRGYFLQLTSRFLAPIEAYLQSLLPADVSALLCPPRLPVFRPASCLAFISARQWPGVSGKRARDLALYTSFFTTPNFSSWYRARERQLDRDLDRRYISAMLASSLCETVRAAAPDEVVLVDCYLRLAALKNYAGVNAALLIAQLDRFVELLPAEIRVSIRAQQNN